MNGGTPQRPNGTTAPLPIPAPTTTRSPQHNVYSADTGPDSAVLLRRASSSGMNPVMGLGSSIAPSPGTSPSAAMSHGLGHAHAHIASHPMAIPTGVAPPRGLSRRSSLASSSSPNNGNGTPTSPSAAASSSFLASSMAALKLHQVQEERRASVASPASNAEHAAVVTAAPVTVVSGSGESCTVVGRQRTALVHHHQDLLERVDKFRNQGSVLTRGTLLKRDHFPRGVNDNLQMYLEGAPNFRLADLNVFGVSQPTSSGLMTILSMINCNPAGGCAAMWFNTREEPIIYIRGEPFVLRDVALPKQNIRTFAGISAARLEQMESRLKDDILNEMRKCNGLILVHDELENESIVPAWIAAAPEEIQTTREIFDQLRLHHGFRISYTRTPISPEQRPEDRYLDEYLGIVRGTSLETALIFNCGMGVGRTLLIRRAQIIASGQPDPYPVSSSDHLHMDFIDADTDKMAILRLVYVLERGLDSKMSPHSAIEWALQRGSLIDNLKKAILGNYNIILSLASVLEDGSRDKRVLDKVINRCDALVNLREEILMNRVRHTLENNPAFLQKALGSLERYFFLLAFAAYVNQVIPASSEMPFSRWIMTRGEVWNMLDGLRRRGPYLFLFRPVEDLSAFATSHSQLATSQPGGELEHVVIRNRNGAVLVSQTILKVDHWSTEMLSRSIIKGAPNFRHIPSTHIFGVAQPTLDGMRNTLMAVRAALSDNPPSRIVWINLREEPLVYINGVPYVLRDGYFTLRNIKAYSGITASRLELLENRLKDDVTKELGLYEGKILLHEEFAAESVQAVWTDVPQEHVLTLKDTVDQVKEAVSHDYALDYYRVPVTAEAEPEALDFDQLIQVVGKYHALTTAFVLNCQIGHGRSTTGTVVVSLVLNWMRGNTHADIHDKQTKDPTNHYQVIHSLLRVIRNGLECKQIVDQAIDNCAAVVNIRDVIEERRVQAEDELDKEKKAKAIHRGHQALCRYFLLIAFQSYLEQCNPECLDDRETFSSWFASHKEFVTLLEEVETLGERSLLPVGALQPGEGVALTSEVATVVHRRRGSVLAQQMILKYDHFPGCQKLQLHDRIDGAPNFRCVEFAKIRESIGSLFMLIDQEPVRRHSNIYGVAMPTRDAIRLVLKRMAAVNKKRLLWTSLREEPVLYVNGKPYVLRTSQDPLKNLETTGIERDRVERMETRMKHDVLKELQQYGGRFLLHEEEVSGGGGGFAIVPIWEAVKEEDVQTPREVFESIRDEGYAVEYLRIPVTDEQAPIPTVFDMLLNQVSQLDDTTDILFNCQMGRGRTTTGMVIACVVEIVRQYGTEIESMLRSRDRIPDATEVNPDESDRERFLRGEYRIVLQLISVLEHGKLSKLLVDRAINSCYHIQNIREAIFDFKLRLQPLEPGSKKYDTLFTVALNYLLRYFYLITFASYFLERNNVLINNGTPPNGETETTFPPFSEWLANRREIMNIVSASPDLQ